MDYDLSILIPARKEEFLKKTVEGILQNIQGRTEVIVILDGHWPEESLIQHERLTIVKYPKSIGQRAAINQAARLSKAKYIMKVDAHCSFDMGFDVKMMADMRPDWTMVPIMKHLHSFNWRCIVCGSEWYQGPTPTKCLKNAKKPGQGTVENKECTNITSFEKVIVWQPRQNSPENVCYRFDRNLHFEYFPELKNRQLGDIVETMSLQGSCFMMTRKKFWELEVCDEKHGSWGQQGVEVACKTWLSGGKVMCNKKTWYAHMFRTQGGDFGFPYPNLEIEKAREYSKDLWLNNKWPQAKYPLSWLIDRFSPVPDWDFSKGAIYYTDNKIDETIAVRCRQQLKKAFKGKIVSASLSPLYFAHINIHVRAERGYLTMFKQQLAALEACKDDIVFFCEHDVLYHPSHFDFIPTQEDTFYYNINVWKVRKEDGHALWVDNCVQVSGLCGYRKELIKHYRERIALVEKDGFSRNMGFEPGTNNRVKWQNQYKASSWQSQYPNIDIRHDKNLTPNRWRKDQFRNQKNTEGWKESTADKIPGWDNLLTLLK